MYVPMSHLYPPCRLTPSYAPEFNISNPYYGLYNDLDAMTLHLACPKIGLHPAYRTRQRPCHAEAL